MYMVDNWKLLFPLFHAFYRSVISIPTHSFRNANQNSFFSSFSFCIANFVYAPFAVSTEQMCCATICFLFYFVHELCIIAHILVVQSVFFLLCCSSDTATCAFLLPSFCSVSLAIIVCNSSLKAFH